MDRDEPDRIRMNVDGVEVTIHDPTGQQDSIDNSPLIVLGEQGGGQTPMNGQLADFVIHHRVLDRDEIARIAQAAPAYPLPRFTQPVENEIQFSLLPDGEYDEPGIMSVRICSPGPGGGMSGSVELAVAAPSPVLRSISPRQVIPGSGTFEILVEVPLSVPYFLGFEQERIGNFNKASVVQWDNTELETTFVSPGTLRAVVPASLVASSDSAIISVFTPDNGTVYFDDIINAPVLSGGVSHPIPFAVREPSPEFIQISPDYASAAQIDRCPDMPETLKLTVRGRGFMPGATIWFDGQPMPTSVQTIKLPGALQGDMPETLTNSVLFTYLEIDDLENLGEASIVVVNPAGYVSQDVYLEIVDETEYELRSGVVLPPQSMPGMGCGS